MARETRDVADGQVGASGARERGAPPCPAGRDVMRLLTHELRGPLSTIIGFSELLLEDQLSPECQREYLHIYPGRGAARRRAPRHGDRHDTTRAGTTGAAPRAVSLRAA